ncbi:hypothetical protein SDC9_169291 [bioreactor metagenome]|uniref:Uncharacterized protein n=1 Tax=bioreactor metagenome TaxID=1076179 RepID=A0A645G7Z4_9ZZZZ
MVGTAHFDDVFLFGGKARHANRRHAGLGAGAQHAEHLDGGHVFGDFFGQLVFKFVEKAGARAAVVQQLDHFVAHLYRVAAQHGGAARLQKVVVFVAVNVVQKSALRFGEYQRKRVVECKVMLHPAGDDGFCLFDHLFGFCAFFGVVIVLIRL